jgi:hypothetical protein
MIEFFFSPIYDEKDGNECEKNWYYGRGEGKKWPGSNTLLVPGNNVTFDFSTASMFEEGVNQEDDLKYGFKCSITGCEISDKLSPLITLTRELSFALASCIGTFAKLKRS